MKFRRVVKPESYPQRYVEGFAAKYDFIRTSSLSGCGAIGRMLRIFRGGSTAVSIAPAENTCEPFRWSAAADNGAVYEFRNWLKSEIMKFSCFLTVFLLALLLFFTGCQSIQTKQEKLKSLSSRNSNAESSQKANKETSDAQYEELLQKILDAKTEEKKENKPIEPYKLIIGDVIEVSVLDEPEMTRELTIIPDGSITYLLVGEIPAAGETIAELRENIAGILQKYYVDPRVSVILKKVQESKDLQKDVSILGAVQSPKKYMIDNGDRVLDIVAKAGGLLYINDFMGGRSVANLKASYIIRDNRKLNVDFDKLMRLGDMTFNILVEDNDFIYIAEAENSLILVIGEVTYPQIIPYNRDISVVEALSRCQGFTEKAEKSRVIILRNSEIQNEFLYVDVEALLYGSKDEKNVILQGGDIVWVPEQGMSEYARYAQYLTTFANTLLSGYSVRDQILFPRLHRNDQHYH